MRKRYTTQLVLDALFPSVRRDVLKTLLAEPSRWWYASELAHGLGTSPSSLQRELPSLVAASVLEERQHGGRTYYRAQQRSPLYGSLHDMFTRTLESNKKDQSAAVKETPDVSLVQPESVRDSRKKSQNVKCSGSDGNGVVHKIMEPACCTPKGRSVGVSGGAMKVMTYPRPAIKATLVMASRKTGLSLSSFIIRAALEQEAAIRKCEVTDLISAEEFAQYV
jgi:DNA-binding transcriptional ArsR family regulator